METKSKRTGQFQENLLNKNPGVDVMIIDAYRKLELQLLRLGVKVKRRYSIEPPLGFDRNKLHTSGFNRNKSHNQP